MKRPRYEHIMPSGGWKLTDHLTGITFKDNHLGAIVQKVRNAWAANDIEAPSMWEEEMRNQICEQNPNIDCVEVGQIERHISLDDVWRFIRTAKNWLDQGGNWVDTTESERRAEICSTCPKNVIVHNCMGCKWFTQWVANRAGMPPPTTVDANLQSCEVCGCYNRLAVHMPMEAMVTDDLDFPDRCWKKKVVE